jgi:hypothetical protein
MNLTFRFRQAAHTDPVAGIVAVIATQIQRTIRSLNASIVMNTINRQWIVNIRGKFKGMFTKVQPVIVATLKGMLIDDPSEIILFFVCIDRVDSAFR